jgi:Holliday junction resolvasome RuvABC endonuclease subunit
VESERSSLGQTLGALAVSLTRFAKEKDRKDLLLRLRDETFIQEAQEAAMTRHGATHSSQSTDQVPTDTVWFLGLDPAKSTGYAFVQVSRDGTILSARVGTFDVSDRTGVERGIELAKLTRQLMITPPDFVFMEDFITTGTPLSDRSGVELRYAMEVELHPIQVVRVKPQTWKSFIAPGHGNDRAKKGVFKQAIEEMSRAKFPTDVPINVQGKRTRAQDPIGDASDALGVALWGVNQHHQSLRFDPLFTISEMSFKRQR